MITLYHNWHFLNHTCRERCITLRLCRISSFRDVPSGIHTIAVVHKYCWQKQELSIKGPTPGISRHVPNTSVWDILVKFIEQQPDENVFELGCLDWRNSLKWKCPMKEELFFGFIYCCCTAALVLQKQPRRRELTALSNCSKKAMARTTMSLSTILTDKCNQVPLPWGMWRIICESASYLQVSRQN